MGLFPTWFGYTSLDSKNFQNMMKNHKNISFLVGGFVT